MIIVFKNLKFLTSLNKGLLIFSFLKYLELAISAFTTFYVAKKIGPTELGYSIPILLYITYSNYLSLGLNQALMKNKSRFTDEIETRNFITANLQYLLLACLINIIICYFVLDTSYVFLTCLISCGILLRGFFSAYFRAIYKIWVLNINNTLYSLLLLSLVFLYVNTWYEYMNYWAISIWICIFLYFISDYKYFWLIIKQVFRKVTKDQLKFNLLEGIKLAFTGLITTFLLTADRIIVNNKDYLIEVKGTYQLADYFGTAFYMFITTIFFYYYPKWIERIRNDVSFRKSMITYIRKAIYIAPFFSIVFFFIAKVAVELFFEEYKGLEYMTACLILLKSYVIINSLYSIYYTGMDKEHIYIRQTLPVCALFVCFGVFLYYKQDLNICIIALSFSILLMFEAFRRSRLIKKKLLY